MGLNRKLSLQRLVESAFLMTQYTAQTVFEALYNQVLGPISPLAVGLVLIVAGLMAIHFGLYIALWLTGSLAAPLAEEEAPALEEVIGIGDDGELLFASEKPKANDSTE